MIAVLLLQIENEDDRDFMSVLYERYRRLMLSEIYKLIHDSWVAEDLMQDTIVKLIDKVELLKTMDSKRLSAYVVTSAKNQARDYLRKAAVRKSTCLKIWKIPSLTAWSWRIS